MYNFVWLITLLPLTGFVFLALFGNRLKNEKLIGIIGSATVGLSFIFAFTLFLDMLQHPLEKPVIVNLFTWIQAGNFSIPISYQVDQLSIIYSLVITGVGFLIHIYSIGYMHGDRGFF